jgi:hypothetical protein
LGVVDPLYTRFKVVLTLASKPATSGLIVEADNLTVEKRGSTRARMVLDSVGIYTFDETVTRIGDGSIDTFIILTLEDNSFVRRWHFDTEANRFRVDPGR